jgi:hypothetical protein
MMNDTGGGQSFWQLRVKDPEKMLALSGSCHQPTPYLFIFVRDFTSGLRVLFV